MCFSSKLHSFEIFDNSKFAHCTHQKCKQKNKRIREFTNTAKQTKQKISIRSWARERKIRFDLLKLLSCQQSKKRRTTKYYQQTIYLHEKYVIKKCKENNVPPYWLTLFAACVTRTHTYTCEKMREKTLHHTYTHKLFNSKQAVCLPLVSSNVHRPTKVNLFLKSVDLEPLRKKWRFLSFSFWHQILLSDLRLFVRDTLLFSNNFVIFTRL